MEKDAKYKVAELFWGTGNPFGHPFDVILGNNVTCISFSHILGADLTYDFEDLPILLKTASDLMGDQSVFYIGYGKKFLRKFLIFFSFSLSDLFQGKERAAIPTFFELASHDFQVEYVPDEHLVQSEDLTYTIGIAILKKKK